MLSVKLLFLIIFVGAGVAVYLLMDDGIDIEPEKTVKTPSVKSSMPTEMIPDHTNNVISEKVADVNVTNSTASNVMKADNDVLEPLETTAATEHFSISIYDETRKFTQRTRPFRQKVIAVEGKIDGESFVLNIPSYLYDNPAFAKLSITYTDGTKKVFSAAPLLESVSDSKEAHHILEMDSEDPENYDYYEKEIILPPKFN